MSAHQLLALLGLTTLLNLPASAQGILDRYPELGNVVGGVGDLDGDGHPEILVGRTSGFGAAGEIRLVSVVDGSTLRSHFGAADDDGFGRAIAVHGDIDADGVGDYAISTTAGVSPGVRLHSGASGAVIRTLTPPLGTGLFGTVMSADGDVDGDSVRDLMVTSAGGASGPPAVWLFPGRTGNLIRSHSSGIAQDLDFGCALSILGDTDGDGRGDYAIGNSRAQTSGDGEVRVYSGASGGLLYTLIRPAAFASELGASISPIGDVNGDGHADLVVGAPSESHLYFLQGMLFVYSGFDGSLLVRSHSQQAFDFGLSVLSIADYDGDGTRDILGFGSSVFVGGVINNRNTIQVISGRTGNTIDWVFGWPVEHGGQGPVVSAET
jgi:hypothetical protein